MENKIRDILNSLTVAEKVRMCHAVTKFSSGGIEKLNIPNLTMSDGPHGVREEICADSWEVVGGDDDFATYLPTGTALAATWNKECAREFGKVLGSEANERKKDVILGPGVNIIRTPLCGRNFEYYSEDPVHSGKIAIETIKGIQSQGTAACVKHFALNNQELRRKDVDAHCDERTLREVYLRPFEMAVKEGQAMTIMGAYNKFRGQQCCQHDYLLNQILKKEWEFDGVVISDWNGVSDTFQAARNGMDIEMGTNKIFDKYYLAEDFENAINNKEIDESILDDKVSRILRLMFRIGIIGDKKRPVGERNTKEHIATAKNIAEEAITLLKNDNNILPLNKDELKKLLIIGDNATRIHHLGGHSSAVKAFYEISPLQGITKLLENSNVEIEYIKGYPNSEQIGESIPTNLLSIADKGAGTRGWNCEFYDNMSCAGAPVVTIPTEEVRFDVERDLPKVLEGKDFGVIFTTELTPQKDELWNFYLSGISQANLRCDDFVAIENCKSHENMIGSNSIKLEKGRTYKLMICINLHKFIPLYPVRLTVNQGEIQENITNMYLLDKAKNADAVLFFGGLNHSFDAEGSDRKDIEMPGGQNELIEDLCKQNKNFVFIGVGGSAMSMPWVDNVNAIVQMYYSGMECGAAIANILFGLVNPSGKLPFTMPKRLEDTAPHALNDYHPLHCNYAENLFVGYRYFDLKKIEPLFAFGHGLSYTNFEYENLKVSIEGKNIKINCKITNAGKVSGKEIVQLYTSNQATKYLSPIQELKDFQKIELASKESKEICFILPIENLAIYHPVDFKWVVENGDYEIRIASSSRDIRLLERITL